MPKVSVIIPVYNAKDYLKRCLDSVCNQTLSDIEIICIDDCSIDNSLEILNEYAKKYSNMKVITSDKNGGESVARNIGLANATGEYIAFVDNDDEVDLNFYEKLYNKAKETDADIVKGEVKEYGYDGKLVNEAIYKANYFQKSKLHFIMCWWTAIYKRSFITENNISFVSDLCLGGDLVFQNKCAICANKIVHVCGVFYSYYRRENSNLAKSLSVDKMKSMLMAINIIFDNLNEANLDSKDPDGYDYVFSYFCKSVSYFHCKNDIIESSTNALFSFYNKCRRKAVLIENLSNSSFKQVCEKLVANDIEGLQNFFYKNNTTCKMILSELRQRVKG